MLTQQLISRTKTPVIKTLTRINPIRWTPSTMKLRLFTTKSPTLPPSQRPRVSKSERSALRASRKKRAAEVQAAQGSGSQAARSEATSTSNFPALNTKIAWYLGFGIPTAILAWGIYDEDSPPSKVSRMIGLTALIESFTDDFAKPSRDKLLPDWSQMPNVPHDIPTPHTLVLDLEETLVSSTWDRKYGWRHAKRPGVDKFLAIMAQYYEIVLYTPSVDGVAFPVVESLDKKGCIMHHLYRDSTYYKNGVHVKDLNKLNRSLKRMIVLDDDEEAVMFNKENLIRVKPYLDPNDRTDRTLEKITPFLVEIARDNNEDIPMLLRQFQGMDADEISEEYQRRIDDLKDQRARSAERGLGKLAYKSNRPAPEAAPKDMWSSTPTVTPGQLTSKDLVGAAPDIEGGEAGGGVMGWLNRRQKDQQEEQMRKMEKWNEIMMKKQMERQKKEKEASA